MIIIGKISEIDTNVELFNGQIISIDKAYSIVRNTKNKRWPQNLIELAPSDSLYKYYLNEKKNFRWTEQKFWNIYAPQYLEEIKKVNINFPQDLNIFLGCFCENEKMCHRLILGLYLEKLGYEVKSTTEDISDYNKYIKM